jgi:hypothetical protein
LCLAHSIPRREYALAVTLFGMKLELARARALEGRRVGDEEGPPVHEVHEGKCRLYPAQPVLAARLRAARKPTGTNFHLSTEV